MNKTTSAELPSIPITEAMALEAFLQTMSDSPLFTGARVRAAMLAALGMSEPAQAAALTEEQTQLLEFLYGSGEFDGVWFEQPHPKHKAKFWWRNDLRRLFRGISKPA